MLTGYSNCGKFIPLFIICFSFNYCFKHTKKKNVFMHSQCAPNALYPQIIYLHALREDHIPNVRWRACINIQTCIEPYIQREQEGKRLTMTELCACRKVKCFGRRSVGQSWNHPTSIVCTHLWRIVFINCPSNTKYATPHTRSCIFKWVRILAYDGEWVYCISLD